MIYLFLIAWTLCGIFASRLLNKELEEKTGQYFNNYEAIVYNYFVISLGGPVSLLIIIIRRKLNEKC